MFLAPSPIDFQLVVGSVPAGTEALPGEHTLWGSPGGYLKYVTENLRCFTNNLSSNLYLSVLFVLILWCCGGDPDEGLGWICRAVPFELLVTRKWVQELLRDGGEEVRCEESAGTGGCSGWGGEGIPAAATTG